MYAIIEVGARQYSVKKGDIIEVEKQAVEEGKEITLDKVLLISDGDRTEVGRPYLTNAKAQAALLKQVKAKKIISFKYRRRKSSHWTKGHRQQLSRLRIENIVC